MRNAEGINVKMKKKRKEKTLNNTLPLQWGDISHKNHELSVNVLGHLSIIACWHPPAQWQSKMHQSTPLTVVCHLSLHVFHLFSSFPTSVSFKPTTYVFWLHFKFWPTTVTLICSMLQLDCVTICVYWCPSVLKAAHVSVESSSKCLTSSGWSPTTSVIIAEVGSGNLSA